MPERALKSGRELSVLINHTLSTILPEDQTRSAGTVLDPKLSYSSPLLRRVTDSVLPNTSQLRFAPCQVSLVGLRPNLHSTPAACSQL